jgi:hypothetical protein
LHWISRVQINQLIEFFDFLEIDLTWFIRADLFVERHCGSKLSEFDKFFDLIQSRNWGWHPHLDRSLSESDQLEKIFESLTKADLLPSCIRIGEGRGSNAIVKFIAQSGIGVDCSAIPGRFRDDNQRAFDWRRANNDIFYQNCSDYQKKMTKEEGLVLQIPMTTSLVKADYDCEPKLRYIDYSYRNDLFINSLEYACAQGLQNIHIISHPETILCSGFDNGLYMSGFENVQENLIYIKEMVKSSRGKQFKFTNISKIANEWANENDIFK